MATTESKSEFLVRRLGHFTIAFCALLVINFAIPRVMPGDPTTQFVGPGFTEEARQQMLEQFGLNEPMWEQFLLYLINTLTGDFGLSFSRYPTPVFELMIERLPRTLFLMGASVSLSVAVGVPLGAFGAWKFGQRQDVLITQGSLFFRSIPTFWLAILMLFVFGYLIPIFPLGGVSAAGTEYTGTLDYLTDLIYHSVLPIVTLSAYFVAGYTFLMRASLLDILPENYMTIAQTKGLSDREVLFRHAVPPAVLPVITQLGFQIGRLVGGAILVEAVFSYPGMGQLMFEAVLARDFPLIQGTFFLLTLTVLTAMLIADLLYAFLDPRVGGS